MTPRILLAGAGLALALSAPALAQDAPSGHEQRVMVMTGGPGDGPKHVECRIVIHKDHDGGADDAHADQMGHMGGGMHMMMMDGSKGPITRDQFLADHARMFDELDANHDGKLDADELKAAHEHHAGMMGGEGPEGCHDAMAEHMGAHMDEHGGPGMMSFEALDVNKDGRLTFEEFSGHFRKLFDKLDKDHKGFLTKSDWPNHIVVMMRHEEHDGDKHP